MARHIQLLPGEQITLADGTVISVGFGGSPVGSAAAGSAPQPQIDLPHACATPVALECLSEADLESQVEHPIDRATRIVGTQSAIANVLGVTKGAVSLWKSPGNSVPAKHCPLIEEMTHGAVRCEELRPDIRWDVLRPKQSSRSSTPDQVAEDAPNA